jgi:hypothetical protein
MKKGVQQTYSIGETVLVKGRIIRKTESEGNTPFYRLSMCTSNGENLEVPESDIAGSMMNIVKLEEEEK